MRVTSTHIVELAAAATSRAQSRVADATTIATSGLRVQVPSDDPVAWATAQRERMRQALATGTGGAIASSRTDLEESDAAFATITEVVSRAREVAVQGASASPTAGDRTTLATQVTALYQEAVAAANTRGADGHYLLAGAQTSTQPFDAAGVYHGDANARAIASGEHLSQTVGVPGSLLTAANGVDVLPELAKLAAALGANDTAGIQASLTSLSTATSQLGLARGRAGTALAALTSADSARTQLQDHLTGVISDLVEADTVGAASTLAQATNTLAVSRAVSQHVIATLAPSS